MYVYSEYIHYNDGDRLIIPVYMNNSYSTIIYLIFVVEYKFCQIKMILEGHMAYYKNFKYHLDD